MEVVKILKKFAIALPLLFIATIVFTYDINPLHKSDTRQFVESFIFENSDICSKKNDALKAAFFAKEEYLLETSSRILENLIRCDPNRDIYYKEILEIFSIRKQEEEALHLLRFAEVNLSNSSYKDLVLKFNKRFRKPYITQNFDLIPILSDNYNSGINADYIYIFDLPFKVDQKSKPKTGIGLKSLYKMKLSVPGKGTNWDTLEMNLRSSEYPGRLGDILGTSIAYVKRFDNADIVTNILNLRVGSEKYLDSLFFGINKDLSNKSKDNLWISAKRDKYVNNFQTGKGLKLGLFLEEGRFKDIFYERYLANSNSYSYKSLGFNSKRYFFGGLGLDITLDRNIYDEKMAVFQTRRHGQNFQLNLFTNVNKSYLVKLSFIRRKSNIEIFNNRGINFEIFLK